MKRILILDDQATVLRIMRMGLEKAGFEVDSANNGEEALARIMEEHPDAMVTDIEMPRMTGEELCKLVDSHIPDRQFPIVVVTSLTSRDHRAWSSTIPNLKFLEKPLSMRRLQAMLSDYFANQATAATNES